MRKFKTFGVAMVAVLAMSAVLATVAQAQITASSYPKTGTAESALGNDTLFTGAGVAQCSVHSLWGPLNAASSTITVTPTYINCTAFGFKATISMNGCDYTVHDTANNHENKVTINCPAGKTILLDAKPCKMTIGAQGPLGNIVTTTSGNHIHSQANLAGIAYTVTEDGFLCPFSGLGPRTGGSYKQHAPITVIPLGGGSIGVP